MNITGLYTALITPFNKDGSIDKKALEDLINFQIDNGVTGLVPMGTTGESPTMNHDEHLEVIDITVKTSAGRVPVIAGTGSNCTDEAIEYTQIAKDLGVDASLQVAPYYNKPSQEGFYRHFSAIADAVELPSVLYNIQSRSGANIEASTVLKLASHQNICGIKEASGSFAQFLDIVAAKPDDFYVLSGDDNMAVPFILMGGSGLISVASNSIPAKMSQMIQTALKGDAEAARQMHISLMPLFKSLFIDTNPIPIKYVLKKQGLAEDIYRLPLCELTSEQKAAVDSVLSALKLF